ncbi:DUF2283 domain-containing protein [Candidatus Pacearchaeota archaeon]|nr:DUF2283 domain-containing protein [Candidatus Pacearchaeota archaeon]
MKGQMNLYYDEESDYLEIFVGEPKPNYGEEVSDGVTLFKDEVTNELVGIGILGFKKRSKNLHDIKLNLPIDIGLFSKEI